MYPNQQPQMPPQGPPQTPPQAPYQPPAPVPSGLPTDYLNQIAPQAPKKPIFTFGLKQIILLALAAVVLVIILVTIVNSINSAKRDPLEHLAARFASTETVATNAQVNLKSSKLRSLNSTLKIYMTNTNRDIAAPYKAIGIDTTKLSKSIVAKESTTALDSRLEDARLNAVYDATYAREMTYQLGTLLTLLNQNYKSASNAQLKEFLKTSYTNLEPLQESFSSYSSATDD